MATKTVYLKGPVKFAKVFEFNRDKGKYAPKDGEYQIGVGLDKKTFKIVKKWNRMYKGTVYAADDKKHGKWFLPGDEDLTYVTFKRKHKHFKTDSDEVIDEWSGVPDVRDEDGIDWLINPDAAPRLIGNGSVCTIKLEVTSDDAGRTFVRLEAVRVDEHVEFEGEGEREPDENLSDGIPF